MLKETGSLISSSRNGEYRDIRAGIFLEQGGETDKGQVTYDGGAQFLCQVSCSVLQRKVGPVIMYALKSSV